MIPYLGRCAERALLELSAKGSPLTVGAVVMRAKEDPEIERLCGVLQQGFASLGGDQIVNLALKDEVRTALRKTDKNGQRLYRPMSTVYGETFWKRVLAMTASEMALVERRIRRQGETMIRNADGLLIRQRLLTERGPDAIGEEVEQQALLEMDEMEKGA